MNVSHNTHLRIVLTLFALQIAVIKYANGQGEEISQLRSVPLLKHFSSNDFGGGIQSWAFDQDSLGFLYVANNHGLLEFDGNTWKIIEVPNCNRVRAVKIADDNRIFVGGQGQIGFFTLTKTGYLFTPLLDLLPPGQQVIAETWNIIGHDEHFYFHTESQLFDYNGTEIRALELPGYVQHIFKVNNQVMAQIYNAGLFRIIDGRLIQIEGSVGIPEILVGLPGNGESIYLGTAGQVYTHNGTVFARKEVPVELGTITSALKLASGDYAIGTQNSGLYILDQAFNLKKHLTRDEGLSDRTVKALHEDEYHNLWVALNNGIDYLECHLPLSVINYEIGVEGTGYAACKFNNKVFFGTNNGLFIQPETIKNNIEKPFEILKGSEGQVYNFSVVDGDLILNHNRGAFLVEKNDLREFHGIGSWKLIPTARPGLALGGDYQGIWFFERNKDSWYTTGKIPNLNESSRIMEFENDSVLWMTHDLRGAYRLSFDKNMKFREPIMRFGEQDGFPSNKKISVYKLNNSLIFTAESGVYNYDPINQKFNLNIFFDKWLGRDHVNEIVSDGNETIYYIQNGAMGVLKESAFGNYQKKTGLFKHINKLINDDLPNITVIDKKNILIGAKEGFILYNPELRFSINENFKVILRSVEIEIAEDSIVKYYLQKAETMEIEANQSLTFSYTSPYFDGFENLSYSYRMLPLEENWSEWSTKGEMKYPYLPPGNYTFEVKAKNVYDHQSSVSQFGFKVLNPWYFSMWAKMFYVFFGLFVIILILVFQKRKHEAESYQIAEKSEQALKSKDEEIDQIMGEKLKTEINLKNDQLTTITMHLMNTTDLLQTVRDKIQSFKKQNDNAEMDDIIKLVDEKISDQNSWDQFAYHFDQVHSGYLKKLSESNVKLSPREIKLASFLRMNMSSKEISKLLNISDRGVELARYRLRKKLNLSRDQNLVEYLIDLDN